MMLSTMNLPFHLSFVSLSRLEVVWSKEAQIDIHVCRQSWQSLSRSIALIICLRSFFEVLTSIMQIDYSCSSIKMGDINIDLLKVSANTSFMEYCIIMTSFNLRPLIRRLTRVTDDSTTLIDQKWTNEPHTFFAQNRTTVSVCICNFLS